VDFWRPPRSLGGRLTLVLVGVVVLPLLVLTAIVPALARAHQLAALEDRLAAEAQLVADYAARTLARDGPAALDDLAKRLGAPSETRITIIAPDGTVLGESDLALALVGNHADRPEVRQALAGGRGVDRHHSETVGYDMLYVAVPIVDGARLLGVARAALPLSQVESLVDQLVRALLLAAAGAGLLALCAALLAAGWITRPLSDVSRLAAALAGDPGYHAQPRPATGPAEIVQLGETLDRLAGAVRDSLERVGAERDRLDAVLAHLADGVLIVDGSGRVARLNAAAERLLGMPGALAGGRTAAEVLRDHELVQLVEQARAGPDPAPAATAFVEWHRPRRWLRAAVTRFGTGESSQTLLLLQDLTELRRLETVRRDFVANVSHELRTPIAAIKVMAETLREGAVDDPTAARDFVARIEEEIDGLHRLVEELLELTRLESGRVEVVLAPTPPATLVASAVHRLAPLAERAGVALRADDPPALPAVLADRERLEQVLVGVIHNAIKFTPPGGAIDVRLSALPERVQIAIADTGVGVAPEQLGRLFERFYKADQARAGGGTGLGLAIAKHTVQLHGGEIAVDSPGPGRGTTVTIALRRADGA
jgi:two-component system, OmpR family, phosphate regulon sensor histidine kinase PhoR